jgi:hypothetical protein
MAYAFEQTNVRAESNLPMMHNVVRMADYQRRPRPGALARRPDEHCMVIILPRLPLASSEGRRVKSR